MPDEPVNDVDLMRWSEALAGIARTGLAFTDSLYERERFEEVLRVAADIRVAAQHDEGRFGAGELVPVGSTVSVRAWLATSRPRWRWAPSSATRTASCC